MMWRPLWLMGIGQSTAYAFSVAVFVLGLYGLLRSAVPRIWSACATVLIVATPLTLGYLTYFGRDQWFTGSMLASFGAALATARSAPGARRRMWSVVLFALLWATLATRQNAAPVVGVALIAWVSLSGHWRWLGRFNRTDSPRHQPLIGRAVRLGVAAALLLGLLGAQTLVRSVGGVQETHPEQQLFLFDLAALSVRENQLFLDPEFFPAQDLEVLRKAFNPYNSSTIVFSVNGNPPLTPSVPLDRLSELRGDWLNAIRSHPASYLASRSKMELTQLAWDNKTAWIYHPQIDPNPWGYHFINPELQESMDEYLRASAANDYLQGGWIYEVWIYLLITLLGIGYLASGRHQHKLLGLFCFGSIAYHATIFFAIMGVEYRFAFPTVVLSLVVVAVATADLVRLVAQRRHLDQPDESDSRTGTDDSSVPGRHRAATDAEPPSGPMATSPT